MFPEVLEIITMFFFFVFLVTSGFLSTRTLTEICKAYRASGVVLGSSVTSWMSHRCALGVILVEGSPLFHVVSICG